MQATPWGWSVRRQGLVPRAVTSERGHSEVSTASLSVGARRVGKRRGSAAFAVAECAPAVIAAGAASGAAMTSEPAVEEGRVSRSSLS